MEMRRRKKEKELYGAMTFVPDMDPLSRAIGRTRGLQELTENRTGERVRAIARMTVERIQESECTFRPQINPYPSSSHDSRGAANRRCNADPVPSCWAESYFSRSHEVHGDTAETDEDSLNPIAHYWLSSPGNLRLQSQPDNDKQQDQLRSCAVNPREPDRMAHNIRQHQVEKEESRRAELAAREIEEMKECTFQPSIASYPAGGSGSAKRSSAPVLVRGLGRHLELKHLSLKQREETERREKEVFSVKNIDQFRRVEDGSTIVKVNIVIL